MSKDPAKRRERLIRLSKHQEDERRAELRPLDERVDQARALSESATRARCECELALRLALQAPPSPGELARLASELARTERSELNAARVLVAWEAKASVAQERVDLARRDRRALENWSERLSAGEVARRNKQEEVTLTELARLGRIHREQRTCEQRSRELGNLTIKHPGEAGARIRA